jgi:hypothetical protein
MKLLSDLTSVSPVLRESLQLVIEIKFDSIPGIYVAQGMPRPDRHMLLGLVQTMAIAIEEQDTESVVFLRDRSILFDIDGEVREIIAPLVVMRGETGVMAALIMCEHEDARRIARKAVRYFTSKIRLDIP